MMVRLFIFGLGYSSGYIAAAVRRSGGEVFGCTRDGRDGSLRFDDAEGVRHAIATSTHILSSVPPGEDGDPVLELYGDALQGAPARWIGYLSSTGVYGDTRGAWVDETAPVGLGRRSARAAADIAWQTLRDDVRVFRLPGIYGPGRSALERVATRKAHRIDAKGQMFSRIHVDDIASGVIASFDGPAGVYNLADDQPAPGHIVTEYAATLLGVAPPPLQTLEDAGLSGPARAFYSESRRVANGRAKRQLGWHPAYPDYRAGLRALMATTSPPSASAQPEAASSDQS